MQHNACRGWAGAGAVPVITTVLLLICVVTAQQQTSTATVVSRHDANNPPHTKEPLLVSLLNGNVVALDRQSGQQLWTLPTGPGLVSSWTAPPNHHRQPSELQCTADAQPSDHGDAAAAAQDAHCDASLAAEYETMGVQVFPGLDGSLFVSTHGSENDGMQGTVQRLPLSVQQLVQQSPSLTQSNGLLLGRRATSVFVVDAASGRVIKSYWDHTPDGNVHGDVLSGMDDAHDGDASPGNTKKTTPRTLVLSRHDYHLQSLDHNTGEVYWNLSFATLTRLGGAGGGALGQGGPMGEGVLVEEQHEVGHDQGVHVDVGGTRIAAVDDGTQEHMWVVDMAAPVAAVLPGATEGPPTGAPPVALPAAGPASAALAVMQYNGNTFVRRVARAALSGGGLSGGGPATSGALGKSTALALMEDGVLVGAENGEEFSESMQCPSAAALDAIPGFLPLPAPTQPSVNVVVMDDNNTPWLWLSGHVARVEVLLGGLILGGGLVVVIVVVVMWRSGATRGAIKQSTQSTVNGAVNGVVKGSVPGSEKKKKRNKKKMVVQEVKEATSATTTMPDSHPHPPTADGIPPPSSPSSTVRQPQTSSPVQEQQQEKQKQKQEQQENQQVAQQQPVLTSSVQARQTLAGGGVRVGQVVVKEHVLGFGSGGTVVYEGTYNGRPVAVKRLLRHLYHLAHKELNTLILSDEHPNIVRCFAAEEDHEFLYLALERCCGSLAAIGTDAAFAARFTVEPNEEEEEKGGTEEMGGNEGGKEGREKGKEEGTTKGMKARQGGVCMPSAYAMQVARDVCEGLAALHKRGIVHRDLKPHNVLLTATGRAKLSDMGLSRRLGAGESSFETMGTPGGSSGWQAPEQLVGHQGEQVKQSKAMDVFSCGILLFYVLTGGSHPFGATFERDYNILSGQPNLSALSHWPEAVNLVAAMIDQDPKKRPPITAVMGHPMWWGPQQGLQFLIQVSDRTEYKDWEEDKTLPTAMETYAPAALSKGGLGTDTLPSWAPLLDPQLLESLGRYRRYNTCSLRDLLRVIRNKHNHYRELPGHVQKVLGKLPDGYLRYFSSRFPQLLMAVVAFVSTHCPDDPLFQHYLPPTLLAYPFFTRFMSNQPHELPPLQEDGVGLVGGVQPAPPPTLAMQQWVQAAQQHMGEGAHVVQQLGAVLPPVFAANPTLQPILPSQLLDMVGPSSTAHMYLVGPRAASSCPPLVAGQHPILGNFVLPIFPQRPGSAPPCDFFMKTGHCKFGMQCHYHHPEHCMVPLSMQRLLPLRPGQMVCSYYTRHGVCKFGPTCRFHHPPEVGGLGVAEDVRMLDDPWSVS